MLSPLIEAHWSFLLIALFIGGLFITITPPLWGTDEGAHFFRAYQISIGHYSQTAAKNNTSSENYIPESFNNLNTLKTNDIKNIPHRDHASQINDAQKYHNIGSKIPSTEKNVQSPYGPILYPIVAYAAPSSVMFVEAAFHPSTATLLYSARFATLMFYILIVTFALYIMKATSAKWILFLIALLPTSLYSASIVNADSVLLSFTLLFASCIYSIVQNRQLEKWKLILLVALTVLITWIKPPYLILVLPLAFLPLGKSFAKTEKKIIRWGIPLLCIVVAAISIIGLEGVVTGGAGYPPGVNVVDQLRWLVSHPLSYILMIINSTLIMDWVPQIIGIFGSSFILVPGPIRQLLLVWLALSIFLSVDKKEVKQETAKSMGYAYIFAAFGVFVAVVSALYLTWTPVGASIVQGVQGRYFIPILAFVMIGIRYILKQRIIVEKAWKLHALNLGITITCLIGSALFYYKALYH